MSLSQSGVIELSKSPMVGKICGVQNIQDFKNKLVPRKEIDFEEIIKSDQIDVKEYENNIGIKHQGQNSGSTTTITSKDDHLLVLNNSVQTQIQHDTEDEDEKSATSSIASTKHSKKVVKTISKNDNKGNTLKKCRVKVSLTKFQKYVLRTQYSLNDNWSSTKISKLAKFLDLSAKKIYKWKYDQGLSQWRILDSNHHNRRSNAPFYLTSGQTDDHEYNEDIILFETIRIPTTPKEKVQY